MNIFMIGFPGAQGMFNASYGEGTGRIWLSNVQCSGSEFKLSNCQASSIGVHSCTHAQDAGVKCEIG